MAFYAILDVKTGDILQLTRGVPHSLAPDRVAVELPDKYETVKLWLQRRDVGAIDELLATLADDGEPADERVAADIPPDLHVYDLPQLACRVREEIDRGERYGRNFAFIQLNYAGGERLDAGGVLGTLATLRGKVRPRDAIGLLTRTEVVVLLFDVAPSSRALADAVCGCVGPGWHPITLFFPEDREEILSSRVTTWIDELSA